MIDALKDYAWETSKISRKANHDINRMTFEKITSSEVSMIRLRDIMMSVMFEQAEEIRRKCLVTAEEMSNIVVNYPVQIGLDEKAQKPLKKPCLQMFKCTE